MVASGDVIELLEAMKSGDWLQARRLLQRDTGLAKERGYAGESPLLAAAQGGRRAIADMILGAGSDLDVLEASTVGQADRVRQLLKSDPSLVQVVSHHGWTPLHLAAYFGHEPVAAALIAAAADVNRRSHNDHGHTPLHAAVSGEQLNVVKFLIKHGTEVVARDAGGSTAVHLAAHAGFTDILLILLERGAAVNPVRKDGATPLMTALLGGQRGSAHLLRWKGAQLWTCSLSDSKDAALRARPGS